METPIAANTNDTSKGFVSRLLEVDSDTKSGLMNGIQYVSLAVIPIAIVDMIMKNLFSDSDPGTKGSVELLAEILGQVVLTLVLLFVVHKFIIAIPTYSGVPMTRINYSTLALGFLVALFSLNHSVTSKVNEVFKRLKEMWEGKSSKDTTKSDKKHKNKVSVSQPISGGRQGVPTHQSSRADYINTHSQMAPVQTQALAPTVQQSSSRQVTPQQEPSVTSQDMYGGPSNTLIAAQEPMAANSVLGGGGSWSAW